MNMSIQRFMSDEERKLAQSLSELARCNPFLPERIACERRVLGEGFGRSEPRVEQDARPRESERREDRATRQLSRDDVEGAPSRGDARRLGDEAQIYQELVFYLLYDRFEAELEDAITSPVVDFYGDFRTRARDYLSRLPTFDTSIGNELPHWFAFLFQVRRASHHIFDFIVGSSLPAARLRGAAWQSIFTHDLRRYRRTLFGKMADAATLITGPSGTGKELVAQAIGLSRYIPFQPNRKRFEIDSGQAFFPLNLSALAPTLVESELFGHRRGAFTGALSDRKGWLAVCPALGTVFLDEIGDLDPALQVKLLRVLQTRSFQPLGVTSSETFRGKIVAATNRDLATEMREGRFREDLYYRLCSDLITTPSLQDQLRDAPDDLNDLVLFIARRVVGEDEADVVAEEVTRMDHTSSRSRLRLARQRPGARTVRPQHRRPQRVSSDELRRFRNIVRPSTSTPRPSPPKSSSRITVPPCTSEPAATSTRLANSIWIGGRLRVRLRLSRNANQGRDTGVGKQRRRAVYGIQHTAYGKCLESATSIQQGVASRLTRRLRHRSHLGPAGLARCENGLRSALLEAGAIRRGENEKS